MIPIILEAEAGESYFRAAWVTQWVHGQAKINTSKLKQASGGGIQDTWAIMDFVAAVATIISRCRSSYWQDYLEPRSVLHRVSWSPLKPRTISPAFLSTIYFLNPSAVCERCFFRLYAYFPSAWYLVPAGWFGNQGAGIKVKGCPVALTCMQREIPVTEAPNHAP